jgi:anti-sigma-K factor RskA
MTDVHSLSGAFVLDALDERERTSFSRHMDNCEACSLEVAELRETAARLADDVWSVPPPRMREAVLARVAVTRQDPPLRRSRAPRPHRQSWRHRTTMALVAASMVGLAALSGVVIVQKQQGDTERENIQAVLAAPDARLRIEQLSNGGHVSVVMSASRDAAVVTLAQAQTFDKDHAYQLWALRGGQPASAGVMPAGKGDAILYVTGLSGAETMALTVEPAGGSAQPTTPIVGQVPLTT